MRSKSFEGMACSIAGALDAIGDRWGMLILRDLMFDLSRYEDLRRSTGATHGTLSDRLKHLEANGLIKRRRYQTKPVRYEYILTPKGRDTVLLAHTLVQIGDRWEVAGKKGPPLRFVHRNTGSAVKVAVVDADKGVPVKLADVIPVEGPGADDLVRWRIAHRRHRDVS
jgi:DNA-binding HxlR family transcriptional regulator